MEQLRLLITKQDKIQNSVSRGVAFRYYAILTLNYQITTLKVKLCRQNPTLGTKASSA